MRCHYAARVVCALTFLLLQCTPTIKRPLFAELHNLNKRRDSIAVCLTSFGEFRRRARTGKRDEFANSLAVRFLDSSPPWRRETRLVG